MIIALKYEFFYLFTNFQWQLLKGWGQFVPPDYGR